MSCLLPLAARGGCLNAPLQTSHRRAERGVQNRFCRVKASAHTHVNASKKLINNPQNIIVEFVEGYTSAVPHVQLLEGSPEVNVVTHNAVPSQTVSVITGGGTGHEPAFAGFVGQGMLTAAVTGQVFGSPSARAISAAIRASSGPAGCLLLILNYTGDKLQFGSAAENTGAEGFQVDSVVIGDDCSLPGQCIAGRRGIAGALLVYKGVAGRRGIAGALQVYKVCALPALVPTCNTSTKQSAKEPGDGSYVAGITVQPTLALLGMMMVRKIAGAAAAEGLSLREVASIAKQSAEQCRSVGMATHNCTVPGVAPSNRLGADEIEMGLGLACEPGASVQAMLPASHIAAQMVDKIFTDAPDIFCEECEVAMLVNNMGSTPTMELYIVANAALTYAQQKYKLKVVRLYVGAFITSLDTKGVSISLMPVDQQRLAWLDASTQATAWPKSSCEVREKKKLPLAEPASHAGNATIRPEKLTPQGAAVERALLAATSALLDNAAQLDEWDQRVGDGDCGSTLAKGASAVQTDCASCYPLNEAPACQAAIAQSVRRSMGGTSGALYDIFFTAVAGAMRQDDSSLGLAEAAEAGVAAIQRYGGAKPGDRTMLDALFPATTAFRAALSTGSTVGDALSAAADAAGEGCKQTQGMQARAGRSSYVPDKVLRDTADPGASAVAIWLQAVAKALQ